MHVLRDHNQQEKVQMEDSAIVALYWDRNESALRETSEKYGRYLMKIAWNILADREDAEESVNDTYLHAWNAMPPHRPHDVRGHTGCDLLSIIVSLIFCYIITVHVATAESVVICFQLLYL